MKIRVKLLTTVLILSISFMTFFYAISYKYLLGNIKIQEKRLLENELSELKRNMEFEIDSLKIVTGDWAPWDDVFEYVDNKNKGFEDKNLNYSTLANLKIDLLLLYDKNNNLVKSQVINNNSFIELKVNEVEEIQKYSKVLLNLKSTSDKRSGVINFNGRPMIISSEPITNSEMTKPQNGTLVMGRFIDNYMIGKLEHLLNTKINLVPITSQTVSEDIKNKLKTSEAVIIPKNKSNISIYTTVKDLKNESVFYFEMIQNRVMYLQGLNSLEFYMIFLSLAFVSLFVAIILFINKNIIAPVERISEESRNIILGAYEKGIITESGNDEFAVLAKDINEMLAKIYLDNKEIEESEKRLKMVLDGSNSGYWEYDIIENRLRVSDKVLELLGYMPGELKNLTMEDWKNSIHLEDYDFAFGSFKKLSSNLTHNNFIEYRLRTKFNKYIWVYSQGNIIEFTKEGIPKKFLGIIMDINNRKNMEDEIKYLTYYDKLTGLFNRGYYEFNIERIINQGNYPISIIIGDVNGLKITNDTFGYAAGDKLLQEAAKLLKESCPEEAIICRWGGDEFIVIIQNCDEQTVDGIVQKVKDSIAKNEENLVSISLGYTTKYSSDEDIDVLVRQAEEFMYHNKLLENKSLRNNTLSVLNRTLLEKSHETEKHAERIFHICEKIGNKLNLSSILINRLSLLAKLHDIGKIGIPDDILNKPGKLNESEWEIMKTHTQIGYRIATSVPDIQHVAYDILCHHERYDGAGYPNGLKGEEIPLLARILSIVDAFDVMTNNRPYKKAFSVEMAVEELKICSSTQFDPELVNIFLEVINELEIV